MTSMPASRKARAMIFAPRSCPSRPGFAMTTLIFRATTAESSGANPTTLLEHRRFPPDAPDASERLAHLPHRHVCLGRLDDREHQVAVLVSRILHQSCEGGLDCGRVAAVAQCLDSADLLPLERGIDA